MTRGEEMLSQKKTGLETARMCMIIGDYKFRKGFRGEGGTKFAAIFPAWNIASLSLVIYRDALKLDYTVSSNIVFRVNICKPRLLKIEHTPRPVEKCKH